MPKTASLLPGRLPEPYGCLRCGVFRHAPTIVLGGQGWSLHHSFDLDHERLQALGATPGRPLLDRASILPRVG